MKRHPELQIETQQSLDVQRQIAQDPETIEAFFDKYEATGAQYGVLNEDTWNFDETGFLIGYGRSQKVLAKTKNTKKEKETR